MWLLEVYQTAYLQQQEYPLNRSYYEAWLRGIDADLLRNPSFPALWKQLSFRYDERFIRLVEQRLK